MTPKFHRVRVRQERTSRVRPCSATLGYLRAGPGWSPLPQTPDTFAASNPPQFLSLCAFLRANPESKGTRDGFAPVIDAIAFTASRLVAGIGWPSAIRACRNSAQNAETDASMMPTPRLWLRRRHQHRLPQPQPVRAQFALHLQPVKLHGNLEILQEILPVTACDAGASYPASRWRKCPRPARSSSMVKTTGTEFPLAHPPFRHRMQLFELARARLLQDAQDVQIGMLGDKFLASPPSRREPPRVKFASAAAFSRSTNSVSLFSTLHDLACREPRKLTSSRCAASAKTIRRQILRTRRHLRHRRRRIRRPPKPPPIIGPIHQPPPPYRPPDRLHASRRHPPPQNRKHKKNRAKSRKISPPSDSFRGFAATGAGGEAPVSVTPRSAAITSATRRVISCSAAS